MISFPSFEPLLNIGYLAASQATRAGRAPHSQCCAPLARTLHVTCRGLLRLRGAQRPYVRLDNASRCILHGLHCVLSLLPRVSDGHPQASARGGLSVERPLHSCMPCPFRCPMYLSLFRLRLPEYTVLLFFRARRLVWSLRCPPSKRKKERKQTTQGRDGRTVHRHHTGISRRGQCGASRHLPLGACLFLSLFAVCRRFSLQPSCHPAVFLLSTFSLPSLLPLSLRSPLPRSASPLLPVGKSRSYIFACEFFPWPTESSRLSTRASENGRQSEA